MPSFHYYLRLSLQHGAPDPSCVLALFLSASPSSFCRLHPLGFWVIGGASASAWEPHIHASIEEATKWISTSKSVEAKPDSAPCIVSPSLAYLRSRLKLLIKDSPLNPLGQINTYSDKPTVRKERWKCSLYSLSSTRSTSRTHSSPTAPDSPKPTLGPPPSATWMRYLDCE
jgi:hypothetical protein